MGIYTVSAEGGIFSEKWVYIPVYILVNPCTRRLISIGIFAHTLKINFVAGDDSWHGASDPRSDTYIYQSDGRSNDRAREIQLCDRRCGRMPT